MTDVTIQFEPYAEALMKALERFPRELPGRLARAMDAQNQFTVSHIQERYLNFPKHDPPVPAGLRHITGHLQRSARATRAVQDGHGVVSSIGSNVKYAAIHEFGGQTAPHKITAKGKALKFTAGGKLFLRKSVNHPGSVMPARRPFWRGIQDRLDDYRRALSAEVVALLKGGAAT